MTKANPKAVGGFVVGAVVLAVAAIFVFGNGRLFQERHSFSTFFAGSLNGLRVGAPVLFRGVQVGTVVETFVQLEPDSLEFYIPVIMEIELDRIRGSDQVKESPSEGMAIFIERGFRAQLITQSFVTGQQAIQLDFFPDSDANIVETDLAYTQIPTVPSRIAELDRSISSILADLQGVLVEVSSLMRENDDALEEFFLNLSELAKVSVDTINNLDRTISNYDAIAKNILEHDDSLSILISNANDAILSHKVLASSVNELVDDNRPGLDSAIDQFNQVERELIDLVDVAQQLIDENRPGLEFFSSDGLYEFRNLAVDAQAAVEQFRRVMEEIERDPARFFLGKPGQIEVD